MGNTATTKQRRDCGFGIGSGFLTKKSISWALYDFGNSAFATTVIAGFFPIFFKSYWASDLTASESTFSLGVTNSLTALVIALSAIALGIYADSRAKKKSCLLLFTLIGCLATSAFFWVPEKAWSFALVVFAIASLGFMAANIFYDSLLPSVSSPKYRHWVSGLGYSLGYLGGGLLFLIHVLMTLHPEWFGLSGKVAAVKWSFLSVGVWWLAFSLPLLKLVDEPPIESRNHQPLLKSIQHEIRNSMQHIKSTPNIGWFLLAYILYIDGVNTTIKMAVDFGLSIGLEQTDLITALLLVQFIGFPAALGFGWLGSKLGPKPGIYGAIGVYSATILGAYFMQSSTHFYGLAISIGLVQGGIQALSRSYYSQIIPENKSGEYFGIFNMVGKFSAIFGPLVVGSLSYVTGDPRVSILSLLIFFAAGGFFLSKVK